MTNPKYPILDDLEIPDALLARGGHRRSAGELFSTPPAALIMRVHAQEIEVLGRKVEARARLPPGATPPARTGLWLERDGAHSANW